MPRFHVLPALGAVAPLLLASPAAALAPRWASGGPPVDLWAEGGGRAAERGEDTDSTMFTFWTPPWSRGSHPHGIWVIAYETNISDAPLGSFLYEQLSGQMRGLVQPEILGEGTPFEGFSVKHQLAVARMRSIHPDDLVVLTDYADVILNPGANRTDTMEEFVLAYEKLMKGQHADAVVISAEAQCCVGALSYVKPGQLVARNGSRTGRACNSGAVNCRGMRKGTLPWTTFQMQLAVERGAGNDYSFLNAGLIAGRARSVIKLLEGLQLEAQEDDQAVMTDFYYRFPELFVMDYNQTLFGNARWPLKDGCVFDYDEVNQRFMQRETGSRPLFLHTSGKYYTCLRSLASRLGWTPPPPTPPPPPEQGGAGPRGSLRGLVAAGLAALLVPARGA